MGQTKHEELDLLLWVILVVGVYLKTILCQPLGGLNDVLCQIYKCLKFAERESRDLYVETLFNKFFEEPFSKAFSMSSSSIKILHVSKENASTMPSSIRSLVERQTLEYEADIERVDFKAQSDRPNLRHRFSGGGLDSVKLTERLELSQWSLRVIAILRDSMGAMDYQAINVRHANYYLSDLPKARNIVKSEMKRSTIPKRLLVLSDEKQMPELLQLENDIRFFDHRYLYKVIAAEVGESSFIQPLVDLAILVNSRTMQVLPFVGRKYRFSGFSRLAKSLWVAKQMRDRSTLHRGVVHSHALSDFGIPVLDKTLGRVYFLGLSYSVRKTQFLKQLIF